MQGNWFHGAALYGAAIHRNTPANSLEHPTNVFLKEDMLIDPIDNWLAEVFEPERVEYTLTQLEAAQPDATATSDPLCRCRLNTDRILPTEN
ncbi:hypothetical protein OG563_42860 [Nocardia vinacea]|uniref:Uncharacterized protein n=1 Tax=Nocardia vinacea TaxID=96468 RepID=A0ABZ1Z7K9_9NOCA|nr:hypothetical protein [Nocardia vinacea]